MQGARTAGLDPCLVDRSHRAYLVRVIPQARLNSRPGKVGARPKSLRAVERMASSRAPTAGVRLASRSARCADGPHLGVRLVPLQGAPEPLAQIHLRFPADSLADLGGVEELAIDFATGISCPLIVRLCVAGA